MRPYHYLTITALPALTSAQGKCRFGNGTLLPDIAEWNIYQPCPGTDGSTTICCAIGRSNPPWGNISVGYTQDDCLPNGLCQNRLTDTDGSKKTTWFVDYCTESGQPNSAGKCLSNVCNTGDYELTAPITPCDGTANSSRWCCGHDTDCCDSGAGVVLLNQVLGSLSSSVASSSATATATSTPSQTSVSSSASPAQTNAVDAGSNKLSGGAIAGIVIGALAGLALLAAALLLARRASRKKKSQNIAQDTKTPVAEVAYTPASQELGPTTKYAHVQEMPGPPPSELHGDGPAHFQKP